MFQQPPTESELRTLLTNYDGQIRKLFNTSGMQYRELGLKDTAPTTFNNPYARFGSDPETLTMYQRGQKAPWRRRGIIECTHRYHD